MINNQSMQKTWFINSFARNASGKTSGSFCASLRMISSTLHHKSACLSQHPFADICLLHIQKCTTEI